MESIGKYLQEKREELKLSVEEVSQQTKMKVYLIEQIENDDFDAIADVGFIKIMVITYTRFLEADTHKVLEKLISLFDAPIEPPIKIDTAKNKKTIFLPTNALYFLLLTILIVFLAFYIIRIYRDGSFSFDIIKNQFATTETRPRAIIIQDEVAPDTLWQFQRTLFHEVNNIQMGNEVPDPIIERIRFFSRRTIQNDQNIQVYNPSRTYLYDNTDYVGEFIFQNELGPLNPEIDEFAIFSSPTLVMDNGELSSEF